MYYVQSSIHLPDVRMGHCYNSATFGCGSRSKLLIIRRSVAGDILQDWKIWDGNTGTFPITQTKVSKCPETSSFTAPWLPETTGNPISNIPSLQRAITRWCRWPALFMNCRWGYWCESLLGLSNQHSSVVIKSTRFLEASIEKASVRHRFSNVVQFISKEIDAKMPEMRDLSTRLLSYLKLGCTFFFCAK